MKNIQYITRPDELLQSIEQMKTVNEIAIDLEFDKNHFCYGFNLCLMQIQAGNQCYLIDPIPLGEDISLVFPILEDSSILKITYAFGEDQRLLNILGCQPKNMIDLAVVTTLLNSETTSLTNSLKNFLNVEVGKSSQKSNWFKRPLSDDQKNYAASDVYHLSDLKEEMLKEVDSKGIKHWIEQESQIMEEFVFVPSIENESIKHKDKIGMSQVDWFVFTELMDYREELGAEFNKPVYQVMRTELVKDISLKPNQAISLLKKSNIHRSLRTPQAHKHIDELVKNAYQKAMQKGLSKDIDAQPRLPKSEYIEKREKRNKINKIMDEVFKPIKDLIVIKYGEYAAPFIFDKKGIVATISGDSNALLPYKREIIKECALELGLEVSSYLD